MNRAQALADVACALAAEGRKAEAISVARTIEDPYFRACALRATIAHLTQPDDRNRSLEETLAATRSIEDPNRRAQVLCYIAPLMTHLEESMKLLSEALSAVGDAAATASPEDLPQSHARDYALRNIACALGTLSKTEEALTLAQSIDEPYFRADALSNIALSLVSAGQLEAAISVVRTILDPPARMKALAGMASMLAVAGNIEAAVSVARTMEDPFHHAAALSSIAPYITPPKEKVYIWEEALSGRPQFVRRNSEVLISQELRLI